MRRRRTTSFAKLAKEGQPPMLSAAFWYDVTERILASLELPAWETTALLLKEMLGLENAVILDEWADDPLDDVLARIVREATRLGVDRDMLRERLAALAASLGLTLRAMLLRSPMAMVHWQHLLDEHGDTPVGTLSLRTFFADRENGGADLGHWSDTVKDAIMVRAVRYATLRLMFGRAVPIHAAIVSWAVHYLGRDPKAYYEAVRRLPLRELWKRQRRAMTAEIKLPERLVVPVFDAVDHLMSWHLGDVTPPYVWSAFHHDLTDLLAGQIDPVGILPEPERLRRFEALRHASRAESAKLYRELIECPIGDTRVVDYLLDKSGAAPVLQAFCWSVVARSSLRRLLTFSAQPPSR